MCTYIYIQTQQLSYLSTHMSLSDQALRMFDRWIVAVEGKNFIFPRNGRNVTTINKLIQVIFLYMSHKQDINCLKKAVFEFCRTKPKTLDHGVRGAWHRHTIVAYQKFNGHFNGLCKEKYGKINHKICVTSTSRVLKFHQWSPKKISRIDKNSTNIIVTLSL